MYHGNIVSSNHNKNDYSPSHTIHIYKFLYKMIKQINIWYAYYTNTYVELIQNIFIKYLPTVLDRNSYFFCPKLGQK